MNRITAGSNGGWIQITGLASRIDPTTFIPALQQIRWPPTNIANSSALAMQRLFNIPGSHVEDPEFTC